MLSKPTSDLFSSLVVSFKWIVFAVYPFGTATSIFLDLKIGVEEPQVDFNSCYHLSKVQNRCKYRATSNYTFNIFSRFFLRALLRVTSVAWQIPSLPFRAPPAKFRVGFLLFTFEISHLFSFIH
jgi:hypothetical protein